MTHSKGENIFNVFNITILFIIGILTLYPFYYVFIYSISNPNQALGGVYFLPAGFSLENYIKIFSENSLVHAIFISVSRTVIGTILTVMGSAIFAYGVSREKLPYRKLIYRFVVISMYISSGLIPWCITMKNLGLKNNFLLYIIPGILVPFFVILIKTYYEQLPAAIEESAMMDGAGYFRIFCSIILPLSLPVLATVAIFAAVGQWNTMTDNLYLCSKPNLMTLQMFLYNFLNQQSAGAMVNANNMDALAKVKITPTSIRMTITVIVVLPIFVVYPFLQRYFLKGIMMGSVKG